MVMTPVSHAAFSASPPTTKRTNMAGDPHAAGRDARRGGLTSDRAPLQSFKKSDKGGSGGVRGELGSQPLLTRSGPADVPRASRGSQSGRFGDRPGSTGGR